MSSQQQDASCDCSALLAHVSQEEAALGVQNDMDHFGHPPAPSMKMFKLHHDHDNGDNGDVLMIAFTKRCVSGQILTTRQQQHNKSSGINKKTNGPFLVGSLLPFMLQEEEQRSSSSQQHPQQVIEEVITELTVVSLEDLSLITVTENQVVFDNSRRGQFDEATPPSSTESVEHATAKTKNLQLRGFIAEQNVRPAPRVAVILGTNKSRVMSIELRWNVASASIALPLSQPPLEPLPLDNLHLLKKLQEAKQIPFCPLGGVNHLSAFVMCRDNSYNNYAGPDSKKKQPAKPTAYVWISYGDGTILRIHHSAFFRSVIGNEFLHDPNANNDMDMSNSMFYSTPKLQDRLHKLGIPLLLRCEAKFSKRDIAAFSIIPMPKYHPSVLAPLLQPMKPSHYQKDEDDMNATTPDGGVLSDDQEEKEEDDEEEEDIFEVCEAVLYAKPTAAVGTLESFPTLCFFTSEDHSMGRTDGHADMAPSEFNTPILGAVYGGTKALASGLVGALAWGFGGGRTAAPAPSIAEAADKGGRENDFPNVGSFPTMRTQSIVKLFAGYEIHDAPRQIESFIIDPEGKLGATTDSFGRIMLVDLSTKQIVRLWKGFREASCCWIEVPRSSLASHDQQPIKKSLFLVIHSRQRRVVEVYRVRHGPRIRSFQVGRDAQIVPCKEWMTMPAGTGCYVSSCYLINSMVAGDIPQTVEKIDIQQSDGGMARDGTPRSSQPTASPFGATNPKEAALRLQRLQQLLANTNVPCQLGDVQNALLQIKSLKDLSTCLDRLAVASVLESKMGVKGTEFQKVTLAYCRDMLKDAIKNSQGDPASNPHVKELATKIVFHSQVSPFIYASNIYRKLVGSGLTVLCFSFERRKVINAFDILRRFEQGGSAEQNQQVAPRSPWTDEAMGWVSTYDMVHGKRAGDSQQDSQGQQQLSPLTFSTFASACVVPKTPETPAARDNRKIEVYLSDSSKARRDVLVHVFKPLLGDIFAFNVVNSIFGALGILDDSEYLLKV